MKDIQLNELGDIGMQNDKLFEHLWKLYDARFEYAWKYFDFHATQRTTMFNFFIIFSGIIISACLRLWIKEKYMLLALASFFGILITWMFIFLERRNEELVHIAEDELYVLEKELLFKNGIEIPVEWPKRRTWFWGIMKITCKEKMVPRGIFTRQKYDRDAKECRESKYLHGTWLPRIEAAICFLYLFFLLFSLWYMYSRYVG